MRYGPESGAVTARSTGCSTGQSIAICKRTGCEYLLCSRCGRNLCDCLLEIAIPAAVCNHIHTISAGVPAMSKRINIMIDDDTWGVLGRIPAGERSRAINEALRDWAARRRRKDAAREMDALRTQLPKVSADEVARWVREDREQGH